MSINLLDKITGEKVKFEKITTKIYGNEKSGFTNDLKKCNMKKYKYLLMAFGLIFLMNLIGSLLLGEKSLIIKENKIEAIQRPEKGSYKVVLVAEIQGKNFYFEQEIPIVVTSNMNRTLKKENNQVISQANRNVILGNKLQNIIRQTEKKNSTALVLPNKLEKGVQLEWRIKKKGNTPYILLLFVTCFGIVYFNRYSKIKRLESQTKKSVLMELPDFINKIVLLLNAGLIFSSAFNRVVNKEKEEKPTTYFLQQLIEIKESVEETNSSLILELKIFSERIQVRELIRTVNIIADNIYKGTFLVEKLEIEGELLLENRRKFAEEQNRIGETKLSFPLAIHLIVLISITISPALLTT